MSSFIYKSLRLMKPKSSNRVVARKLTNQKRSYKSYSSFTKSATTQMCDWASYSRSSSSSSKWFPFLTAPLAYAAFWGSSVVLEMQTPNQASADLAEQVLKRIFNLPNSELRRDPLYVLAAVAAASKFISEVGPFSTQALNIVSQISKFAARIVSDKQQDEQTKIDAQRVAIRAEYDLFSARLDLKSMEEVLLKDLQVVTSNTKSSAEEMRREESEVIWLIAAVQGSLDSEEANNTLEKSLNVFKGISKETLTPDLERFWVERIVLCLTHGLILEVSDHPKTAPMFKRIALALYEQYRRIAPEGADIPEWKDLETRLKASALASGPQ